MKPGTHPLQSTRLLDQLRERIGYLHYSLKTEKSYLHRTRFWIPDFPIDSRQDIRPVALFS